MLKISNPKIIDKVFTKFVIKTIPTISGDPYYESLNSMIQALYADASTFTTILAGVKHGPVSLIMKDTFYGTLATGTTWADPDKPVAGPTITRISTIAHLQQYNETYGKSRQIFENVTTMDKTLKHQIVETIEDTYIAELRKKYKGFMGVKTIYLVHRLMDRYGKISETDLKENHKRFDDALDTIMINNKYFEQIYEFILYVYGRKQQYKSAQIINNAYYMVLSTGLYAEPNKMWIKKPSSEKTWAEFKKFFTKEYRDLRKIQCINATQAGFHGVNMAITMQYNITKTLDNLATATTSEKMLSPRYPAPINSWQKLTKFKRIKSIP